MKIQKLLRNERGDMTIAAVFLILILNILIAFLLLFTTVQIQSANIRSKVKMELNNLSAVISKDTYEAMREGNLEEYAKRCKSPRYQFYLTVIFQKRLEATLDKITDNYMIYNDQLYVQQKNDRIEFTYNCVVRFQVSMMGDKYSVYTKRINITGYHVTKF